MATKNPYNDFYGDDIYNAAGQEYYQRVVKKREEEEAVKAETPKATFKGYRDIKVTGSKDDFLKAFTGYDDKTKIRVLKKLKENADSGDTDSQQILTWFNEGGALKGDTMDTIEGFNDKLGGGIGRGLLRGADFLLPGTNTFGLEGVADEWDDRYAAQSMAPYTEAGRRGEAGGHLAKAITDVGSLIAPTAAVDKAVRGTRAIQALEKGGRAARGAGFVARTIPGSVAGSAIDTMQEVGRGNDVDPVRSGAIGIGADLALPLAGRLAGRGARAVAGALPGNQPITSPTRLLGTGEDTIRNRLDEIEAELDLYRTGGTNATQFTPNAPTMDNLGTDIASTGSRVNASGAPDMRQGLNRNAAQFPAEQGTMQPTKSPQELRALMKERERLIKELDGLESLGDLADTPDVTKQLNTDDPRVAVPVANELEAIDGALTNNQKGKVNFLVDYFRTPPKVLKSIGLGKTAKIVEDSFQNYRVDLTNNQKQIRDWFRQVEGIPGSHQRLFQALDGQQVSLSPEESRVANEIREFLKGWADKLGLPEEKRVSDYITHIFDSDFAAGNNKTIDPVLSQILDRTGTKTVYNPFTEKRLGGQGYKEDVWAALDAYVKRGTRQVNMEPALKELADTAKNVDERTADYLLSLNKRIALKPSRMDDLVNKMVASIPGVEDRFGANAGTRALRGWRNMIYRGTLGLNPGSALRNLTQAANTYSQLGEKHTAIGYSKMMKTFAQAASEKASGRPVTAWDELKDMGILDDTIHRQDESVSAIKSGLQKVDNVLWFLFDGAERVNRASAYYGAKAKALAQNMTEDEARDYARRLVEKTQFKFNDIETPLLLNSQVAKTATQFQSFNIKQSEFLLGMGKEAFDDPKELAKIVRYVGANLVMMGAIGKLIGLEPEDMIPNFNEFRGLQSPTTQILFGDETKPGIEDVIRGRDAFGGEAPRGELAADLFSKSIVPLLVPGGTQAKKTAEGVNAVNSGGSYTDAGRLRFPVDGEGSDMTRAALFGQFNLDEGQDYFGREGEPLSEKQTEFVDEVATAPERAAYYDFFSKLKEVPPKKQATEEIRNALSNKEYERAKRLVGAHNAEIDALVSELENKVGDLPENVQEYLNDYRVNYEYYINEAKRK